ncbi:probable cysteine--tRNA ligase, mitochondrial [Anthonomus grandis grandis]|uniref:probable cysteine--tRNA ligase, mitochondrial n=1 Tax=Anthonomus grandis grandis TaxID=2921223 RepID=UPI00216538C2|nr:probable cysteine--tRNA ligase, mitochondrial [Anthonomus grandis grandis]
MNITDIDDKIIAKAQELNSPYQQIAQKYEKLFWKDLDDLKIDKPNVVLRVTENIPLIIDFINNLKSKGLAYKSMDNSVYFDSSNCHHKPGKLQAIGTTPSEQTNPYKKLPEDFALWKAVKSELEPCFDSPWGKGRPGWHTECSALASYVFGSKIDIHAGGLDLRFPHHENEEIQSCVFHDTLQWVNYWLHIGPLYVSDSIKMSKSLKNTVSIQEMLNKTNADVFRLACAMTQYHKPMEYSNDLLLTAKNLLNSYNNFFSICNDISSGLLKPALNSDVLQVSLTQLAVDIHGALSDDFNTPQVFHAINKAINTVNKMVHGATTSQIKFNNGIHYLLGISRLILKTLNMFGVDASDKKYKVKTEDSSDIVNTFVQFRQDVRNIGLSSHNKEILQLCDNVRDKLRSSGINIKDHKNVSSWSR